MGVDLYLLTNQQKRISVDGTFTKTGVLKRLSKLSELDEYRQKYRLDLRERLLQRPSPIVVMIENFDKIEIEGSRGHEVFAHLILGWEVGRTEVTDYKWDYLPVIGYAVKNQITGRLELHERLGDRLYRLDKQTALDKALIDRRGILIRKGQPKITACTSVKSYILSYFKAACVLETGKEEEIYIDWKNEIPPNPGYFIGKTPEEANKFSQNSGL